MSIMINRFNINMSERNIVYENEESENEESENEENESESENESENENENESESESESYIKNIVEENNLLLDESLTAYVIKIDGETNCYCSTKDDVITMVNYLIENISVKKMSEGWNNVNCIRNKENKIIWKVIDSNRILSQIVGNKPNELIFYDNILSDIEVEIIKIIH